MGKYNVVTDEIWQAILQNDATYNDRFFYAVKTTGIFCRPSCKSRPPKRENVIIFHQAGQALSEKFRPCKRCKPTGAHLPDDEWVNQMTSFINLNYMEKLSLALLSEVGHGSPYHLHRTFKRVTGTTPAQYIQTVRINNAKERLTHSNEAISLIAASVGMTNISYFVSLFKKKTGYTPTEYRQLNDKEES